MTNNEAAKWIQLYIDLAKLDQFTYEAAYLNDDNKKTIEAMEMAINVLTAQPEETHDKRTETHACDCVSRQAAIEVINAVFPVDPMKSEYAQGIACGAALAKTYVEQLPPAQSKITLESAIDYLHKIGWMQEHDRILTESAQPEIIRCRNCKHWTETCGDKQWGLGDCDVFDKHLVMCNGYCAWAERREE
jgi:hypothetical protein